MKIFTAEYNSWKIFYKGREEVNWKMLEERKGYWYADPILVEFHKKKYLFTEAYKILSSIGQIAVSEWDGSEFSVPRVIIKKNYHMSYPCVFEFDHQLYMLPETGQNKTLELYKAVDNSVYNWKLEKVLLKGETLADATVCWDNSNYYIVAYVEGKNRWFTEVFKLDMKKISIEKIEQIEKNQNIERPAGKFFFDEGKLFRPVQYNKERYGGAIVIEEIQSMHPFICQKCKMITVEDLKIPKECGQGLGTHTLSFDDEICIVDALIKGKSLKSVFSIIRKVRNKYYKFLKS